MLLKKAPKKRLLSLCFLQIPSRCTVPRLKQSVVSSLPVLYWLPKYSIWDYGMPDLISGISVGIMHLPQGTTIVHHGRVNLKNIAKVIFCTNVYYPSGEYLPVKV